MDSQEADKTPQTFDALILFLYKNFGPFPQSRDYDQIMESEILKKVGAP